MNGILSYFLYTLSDLSYFPFSCTGVVHAFFTLHLYVFTRLQKVSLFMLFFFNSSYTQSGYFLIFFIPFFLCSSKNFLSVFIIVVVAALSCDPPFFTLVFIVFDFTSIFLAFLAYSPYSFYIFFGGSVIARCLSHNKSRTRCSNVVRGIPFLFAISYSSGVI